MTTNLAIPAPFFGVSDKALPGKASSFAVARRGNPTRRSFVARLIAKCLLFAILSLGVRPAFADYRLGPGDTVEISVAGLPELHQRLLVQTDGSIDFPLLGALKVAGLSPSELRRQVRANLGNKIYRQRTADGREVLVIIQPDEVSASVVDYRPVYIDGDVNKPGALAFRPEMTVRQAIALAGGYGHDAARTQIPLTDVLSLKTEYELLWIDYAKEAARLARITSELNGQDSLNGVAGSDIPLSKDQLAKIDAFETSALNSRLTDYKHEQSFLQNAITQADQEAAVIQQQKKEEEEGMRDDTQELQKQLELLSRGQTISPRVLDARRALLLSSTRTLQITAELMRLNKEKSDDVRQLDQFDEKRRIELLKEQQEASLALSAIKIKQEGVEQKLRYFALARPSEALVNEKQATIRVVREDKKGSTRLDVDENFRLEPGDVIEVSLATDAAPRLSVR